MIHMVPNGKFPMPRHTMCRIMRLACQQAVGSAAVGGEGKKSCARKTSRAAQATLKHRRTLPHTSVIEWQPASQDHRADRSTHRSPHKPRLASRSGGWNSCPACHPSWQKQQRDTFNLCCCIRGRSLDAKAGRSLMVTTTT